MKNTINKISLIIPVYNEEENLQDLYSEITRSLSGLACAWELLLVDDGSTDSSLGVIRALAGADERVRFLSFARNCGQSAAFAAGFALRVRFGFAGGSAATAPASGSAPPASAPPASAVPASAGSATGSGSAAASGAACLARLRAAIGSAPTHP